MKHSVPHDLGKEKALKVTQAAWQSYSTRFSQYHPTCSWPSPYKAQIGFTAKGMSLKGDIEVTEKTIDLELDVPFLLRPFKSMALGVIEEEIKTWIGKAKAGQI
ncbi:MAG TPA: polyhydroxyalkanoic acid system family protein [Polyangiaceae bacterium]|nr:polyhydroxyalkanoic acid system family protein [Polyangiaceae bacterium]